MGDDRVTIYGAGGFGRETLDACLAGGVEVSGFVDDDPIGPVRGLAVTPLGSPEPDVRFVVAIADPAARKRVVQRLDDAGTQMTSVVDPRAIVGPETVLGEGTIVLATAFVSSSVLVADHVQLNYGVTIGHDTVLGRFSTVLPGANIAGGVQIGPGVVVGSGAVVLQGLKVGRGAVVGAGAVVTRDLPEMSEWDGRSHLPHAEAMR